MPTVVLRQTPLTQALHTAIRDKNASRHQVARPGICKRGGPRVTLVFCVVLAVRDVR